MITPKLKRNLVLILILPSKFTVKFAETFCRLFRFRKKVDVRDYVFNLLFGQFFPPRRHKRGTIHSDSPFFDDFFFLCIGQLSDRKICGRRHLPRRETALSVCGFPVTKYTISTEYNTSPNRGFFHGIKSRQRKRRRRKKKNNYNF